MKTSPENTGDIKSIKQPQARDRTLQLLSIPALILWAIDIASGSTLTSERTANTSYSSSILAVHIAVGLLIVAITAVSVIVSLRLPGSRHRVAAGLSLGSILGANIAGAVYLYSGKNSTASIAMSGLDGIFLIAIILLIVWGSVAKSGGS